jgi:hypothetical protein
MQKRARQKTRGAELDITQTKHQKSLSDGKVLKKK